MIADPGSVLECVCDHFVFTVAGGLITLMKGELIIVVETQHHFQGKAIRVETSELVHVNLLQLPTSIDDPVNRQTYIRVWP